VRSLELRRHARRDPAEDRLSPEGRVQAEDVGRTLSGDYAVLFVSPAQRAAETVAWLLRGLGRPLPSHAVVPGLLSEVEDRWRAAGKAAGSSRLSDIRAHDRSLVEEESSRMAGVLAGVLARVPEGGRGLAVGHTPLIEAGILGITGQEIEPLGECEGVLLTQEDQHRYRVEELRIDRP
jgi:broad specificity phosphatase PhoE